MTEWATVVVAVAANEVDEVSGLVWELGVSGIEEQPQADGEVELRIGCERAIAEVVHASLTSRWSPIVRLTAADTGLDAWREHAHAWRAGSTIVVVPPWIETPPDVSEDDLVLLIDPGHSFGSASHETTRRCLAIISELVEPEMRVADIGCGSGVLGIAALCLGAARVVATDISPEAIAATIENASRNGVLDRISVSESSVAELEPDSHQLVLANIGAAALCSMAAGLVALSSPGGRLVLSGVLDVQVDEVVTTFEGVGARLEVIHEDGEWRSIVMQRAS